MRMKLSLEAKMPAEIGDRIGLDCARIPRFDSGAACTH